MKIFQKLIATVLIIGLILSLNLNLLFSKPKETKAFLGIEDTVHDIISEIQDVMKTLKEWGLDGVARFIARQAMNRLRYNLIRWAQGGFRDDNQPLAITSWKDFLRDAVNIGSARFIHEFNLTPLCYPFRFTLGQRLGLGYPYYYLPLYQEYAACTIETIVENVKDFWEDPSIGLWGWDTWTALAQPQNNIYGAAILAGTRRIELEAEEKEAAENQGLAGQGYRDEQECITDAEEACKQECYNNAPGKTEEWLDECLLNCEKTSPTGICVEYQTKNIGSTIHSAIEKTVQSDIDWLITVDEFTDLVDVFISAILNKAIFGLGLAGSPRHSAIEQKYREEYSYHTVFKKQLTYQKQYEVKSKVLARILEAIKSFHRSTMTCDKSTAVNIHMFRRTYADILEEETQALYSSVEGIDLKPDYEVLESAALVSPIEGVYSYSWNTLSYRNYPQKCLMLLDDFGFGFGSTCSDIKSGLPPISTDSRCECIFGHNALTCPPGPIPPVRDYEAELPEALIRQKQDFYNSCRGPYLSIIDRCSDCLKRAEEQCEQISDDTERISCFNRVCDNFGNIAGVIDGQDFYNKCLIEEKKAACYTCLKEYYMPADYCGQIMDYIGRATIKYPGTFRKSEKTFGIDWLNPDSIGWIGVREPTCEGKDSASDAPTDVSLICRIIPDFTWNGVNICRTNCPFTDRFTEKQYYDINDNSPNSLDCHKATVNTQGVPGVWQVEEGAFETRSKCCRAFNSHDPEDYKICAGAGAPGEETPIEPETACLLNEGEVDRALTTTNVGLDIRKNAGLISGGIDSTKSCVILRSSERPKNVTMYITTPYCDAYLDLWGPNEGNEVLWWDTNNDGSFSNNFLETDFWAYCCNDQACTNLKKKPPAGKILCAFDIDATPDPNASPTDPAPTGTDANGEPYKVCCGLSGYGTSTSANCPSGIATDVCNANARFTTGGLYLVAVPDQANSLGGAEWCECDIPSAGCGSTCSDGGCPQ